MSGRHQAFGLWGLLLLIVMAHGCAPGGSTEVGPRAPVPPVSAVGLAPDEPLRVVATTSIVADVVRNVGGDAIALTQLMPLGADPHAFESTPQDAGVISDAHVVFINGVGLEVFMDRLLASAGGNTPVVTVSDGIRLLAFAGEHADDEALADEDHGEDDPHVWFDPNNVKVWVANIESALSELDPDRATTYRENAQAYLAELDALDGWIREAVTVIPEDRRGLVIDHSVFTYFAHAYGFEQVGTITTGGSTLSQPSAREMAALQEAIVDHGVRAIFVSTTVNPRMAEQLARDTGIQVVPIYTGSLSDASGPAGTYLAFMRYDVGRIVEALR
ncbi:MAG: metal ABC transporter substrate-binding protein [Anaerolineae bacterium]|nr:metal ABC transporter substrate-binding protein [Anaerolineae bacterium]